MDISAGDEIPGKTNSRCFIRPVTATEHSPSSLWGLLGCLMKHTSELPTQQMKGASLQPSHSPQVDSSSVDVDFLHSQVRA